LSGNEATDTGYQMSPRLAAVVDTCGHAVTTLAAAGSSEVCSSHYVTAKC